ncbi:MAG: hypothetical protein IT463_07625 [Planctomycetes bacterium]|nr:hypothetical protein [Planctomycetota bacterium]
MKNLRFAAVLLAVAGLLAACGGGYQAPPPAQQPKVNNQGTAPAKGPSRAAEYEKEMRATFAAHDKYKKATPDSAEANEAYVEWAVHLYAALAYANEHRKNGHDAERLPRLQDLKENKSGFFKNARGPSDDPRVKEAVKKWSESAE